MYRADAIVVHGGGLTPDGGLPEKAIQRMDTAIAAWERGAAPNMVVSGRYSFMLDTPPAIFEAPVMKRYAMDKGVPDDVIDEEYKSLDTVGNALYVKTELVVPNRWRRLLAVTSRRHAPRTKKAYQHVMGDEVEVVMLPAPETVTPRDIAYELIGNAMMREVFRGTEPGDDEAIRERLFALVPGYGDSTKTHLAIESLKGLFKRH